MIFTSRRATKVVVALLLCALALQTIKRVVGYFCGPAVFYIDHILNIVFGAMLPLAVFVVNVILMREVRRASQHNTSANLGRQSTSFNSAVPTITLVTTSLLYVLFTAPGFIAWAILDVLSSSARCDESRIRTLWHTAEQFVWVANGLYYVVFAYNFFVYLSWKQFRCELRQLFRCSSSSTNNEAAAAAVRTSPHSRAVTSV